MSGDALDLDALAALEQAATPGPWEALHVAAAPYVRADAVLIAALRNAAPALIAAARSLPYVRDQADRVTEALVESTAKREAMRVERDAARAEVAALRERVEAVLRPCATAPCSSGRCVTCADARAALNTGADQ